MKIFESSTENDKTMKNKSKKSTTKLNPSMMMLKNLKKILKKYKRKEEIPKLQGCTSKAKI